MTELAGPALRDWIREQSADLHALKAAGAPQSALAYEREVLALISLRGKWGGVAEEVGHTVIYTTPNKLPKPENSRYVNVIAVYTPIHYRRRGEGVRAYQHVYAWARAGGWDRIVTAAGSLGGWALHRALGWPAWGVNSHGQVVTDMHLTDRDRPPTGARAARLHGFTGQPLTVADHARIVTDPDGYYRAHPGELPRPYRKAHAP